jgi:manganese/zinc/iron transport system substrate-binding protein
MPLRSRPGLLLPAALLLLALLPGCTGEPTDSEGVFRVTCTVGMLGDLAREIVGSEGEVVTLMGPGTDPHLYKPSPGDVERLGASDVVLFVGHHLEGRMAEVLGRLGEQRTTAALGERIAPELLLRGEEGAPDPHLWSDPSRWSRVAIEIGAVLAAADPSNGDLYRTRAAACGERLVALDAEMRERLSLVPRGRRLLVTAHDAFRYFGEAYDFEVVGVQGPSTDAEAGVRHINDLVTRIIERRLPAIFIESTVPPRTMEALIEGCRARRHTLRIGGELHSDALGAQGSPAATYEGMLRHNVETIVTALTTVVEEP